MDSSALFDPETNHRGDVGWDTLQHTHTNIKTSLYSSRTQLLLVVVVVVGIWWGRREGVTSKAVPMATYRWLTSWWCSCRDNLRCVASLWELSGKGKNNSVGVCCRGRVEVCNATDQTSDEQTKKKKWSSKKVWGWRISSHQFQHLK